eukprot:9472719-Pyramimonas_sp.AAC.1
MGFRLGALRTSVGAFHLPEEIRQVDGEIVPRSAGDQLERVSDLHCATRLNPQQAPHDTARYTGLRLDSSVMVRHIYEYQRVKLEGQPTAVRQAHRASEIVTGC